MIFVRVIVAQIVSSVILGFGLVDEYPIVVSIWSDVVFLAFFLSGFPLHFLRPEGYCTDSFSVVVSTA